MNLKTRILVNQTALDQWAIQFLQNVARSEGQRGNIITRLHDYEGLDESMTILGYGVKDREDAQEGKFDLTPFYEFMIKEAESIGYTQFAEALREFQK